MLEQHTTAKPIAKLPDQCPFCPQTARMPPGCAQIVSAHIICGACNAGTTLLPLLALNGSICRQEDLKQPPTKVPLF